MLFGLILIAIGLAVWNSQVGPYVNQRTTASKITLAGGSVEMRPGPVWLRTLLGKDNCKNITLVNLADANVDGELLQHAADLPEVEVLILGGEAVTDDMLRFASVCESLKAVILDSTLVSDQAIESLRANRPEVHISRSDRRTIDLWTSHDIQYFDYVVETMSCEPRPPAELTERLSEIWLREVASIRPANPISSLGGFDGTTEMIESLRTLHSLQTLELGARELTQENLETICSLQSLKRLALVGHYYNHAEQVTDFSPLARLTELESLSLRGMPVTDEDMQHLALLANLQSLDLGYTNVTDPSKWPLLPLLELDLEDTFIQDADAHSLCRYKLLKSLSLNFTELTDAGLPSLESLEHLETLKLAGTRITNSSYDTIHRFPALQRISIAHYRGSRPLFASPAPLVPPRPVPVSWYLPFAPDKVRNAEYRKGELPTIEFRSDAFRSTEYHRSPFHANDEDYYAELAEYDKLPDSFLRMDFANDAFHLDQLAGRVGIRELDLSNTFACDADMRHLASMPDLEFLDLTNSWVSDAGLEALAQSKILRRLVLVGTRIGDAGMSHLAKLKTLEEVTLPTQTIRGDGFRQLAKLPKLVLVEFGDSHLRSARSCVQPDMTVADMRGYAHLMQAVLGRNDADGNGKIDEAERNALLDVGLQTIPDAMWKFAQEQRVSHEAADWIEDTFDLRKLMRRF